jgi:hypothetical protein
VHVRPVPPAATRVFGSVTNSRGYGEFFFLLQWIEKGGGYQ